ncbi:hypothetical protein V6N13_049433 [Hibiscus sabdariffa]
MQSTGDKNTERRSAGYLPTIWDCELLKSFTTPYSVESHGNRLEELKQGAREFLVSLKDARRQLDLINTIQRLGVAYLFENEIHDILSKLIHFNIPTDLHTVAMHFRILRQNGLFISTDVFDKFMDRDGKFMDNLGEDVKGLLSLYEASFLGMPEEHVLDEAQNFSAKHLLVLREKMGTRIGEQIRQSMEYPQHWRMEWAEARDFIAIYQNQRDDDDDDDDDKMSSVLLELAKLNHNILQSIYLKELQELVEWDLKAVEELPEYMKFFYEAMYNHVTEMVQDALIDNGIDILPYLKEQWQQYVGAYLKEAQWMHRAYNPNAEEYLENAWLSVGIVTTMVYAIFGVTGRCIDQYLSEFVENWSHSDLVCLPAYFARFLDDLKTTKDEMERGESMNFIHFYMLEKGVSEEETRDHVKVLMKDLWKKLNKAMIKDSVRAPVIVKVVVRVMRCCHRIYHYGDFFGTQSKQNQECVKSVLEPIPMDQF